jgi:trimeric autotransporter adhesin
MRTKYKFFPAIALALTALVALSGCGGSGNNTGPITVTVTPSNPSVAVGSMQTFTANVVGGTTPATVTWSVMGSGTIDSSTGVYTAPATVPTTNDVVTATSQGSTGSAVVNVTASQALQISPGGPAIGAGASQAFSASAGGNPAGSVTWQVNGLPGGDCVAPSPAATTPCHGTIDGNGNFIAPLSPPPGGFATISALSGTDSGTTNATILYSSASLTSNGSTGQYALQYAGSDFTSGLPLDVSGSIVTSGSPTSTSGTITGGEIDINSGFAGVATGVAITGGSYNLTAGSTTGTSDGRISMTILVNSNSTTISSFTLQVALTTNQHGLLIDFDSFGTGSGTIDAQNTSSFAGSLNGNYAFTFSGLDPNQFPLFAAGAFTANGGSIPINPTNAPTNTQDIVDQDLTTPIVTNDISLAGTYSATDTFGRGQVALTSTTLGTLTFSYYMIDQTHANLLEIDSGATAALVSGQIYAAPTNATALTGGVAFTAGGSSGGSQFNPYVIGGVFPVTGTTVGTGGLLDINTSSKTQTATPISGGNYNNSTASGNVPGRYTLSLTTSKGTIQFAAYTTTINTALLVQIDTNTNGSTGTAYQQTSPVALLGSFSTNLTGVGESKTLGSFEQDVSGQVVLGTNSGTPVVSSGTFDLNSGASGPVMLPLNTSKSSFKAPTNNRGTAVLQTANGPFTITYYLVSPTTALYIDTDANRVASGVFLDQY